MHFFSALLGVVSLLSMSAYAAASEPESIPNQYIVKLADNTPQAQFNHTLDTVRASLGNEGHIGREVSSEAPGHREVKLELMVPSITLAVSRVFPLKHLPTSSMSFARFQEYVLLIPDTRH